jgi:RHS repeat-associated protein
MAVIAAGLSLGQAKALAQSTNGISLVTDGLSSPTGLTFGPDQMLYVTDGGSGVVYRVHSDGRLVVEAGGFSSPRDTIFDVDGNMFVADSKSNTVYRLDKNGNTSILVTNLMDPCCLGFDRQGNLLVVHVSATTEDQAANGSAITKISPDGQHTLVASGFVNPRGLLVDAENNILVVAENDSVGSGAALFKVDEKGHITRMMELGAIEPKGAAVSPQGLVFFSGMLANEGGVFATGKDAFAPFISGLVQPRGVAVNSNALYVTDAVGGAIWRVTLEEPRPHATNELVRSNESPLSRRVAPGFYLEARAAAAAKTNAPNALVSFSAADAPESDPPASGNCRNNFAYKPDEPGGSSGGEPVNLSSGVFHLERTDMVLPGLMPIVFKHVYRTEDGSIGRMGVGGADSYDYRLRTESATGLALQLPNNSRYPFVHQADGIYINTNTFWLAGAKLYDSGVEGETRFMLRFKDGTRFLFCPGIGPYRLLSYIIDPNGNELHFIYSNEKLREIRQPSGRSLIFTSDAIGCITSVTDTAGRSVGYAYDAGHRLIAVTNVLGGIVTYSYATNGNLQTATMPNGLVTVRNEYDGASRIGTQTIANGHSFTFSYATNSSGAVTQSTMYSPHGGVSMGTYSGAGLMTGSTDPSGNSTSYIRDDIDGALLKSIDPLGRTNSFAYDALRNLVAVTNPVGKVTLFTYEPMYSRMTSMIDPLGRTTSFGYDSRGNLITVTNALGKVTKITYNQFGQPLTVTDPLNNTCTFTYNSTLDLIAITDPLGTTAQQVVDSLSRIVAIRDSLGNVNQTRFNEMNRITEIVDALNGKTSFGYNCFGHGTNIVDALNHSVQYGYDSMEHITNRVDQLGRSDIYRYDKHGNVTNYVDRRGVSVSVYYDSLDRQTNLVFSGGGSISTFYDKVGRVTNIVDSLTGSTKLAYDTLDRLIQVQDVHGSITYGYNDVGLRTNMTVSGTGVSPVAYFYDAANRLTNVVQGTTSASVFYDDAGRRTKVELPNSSFLYGYDAASRLTNITYIGAITNRIDYSYDLAGRRRMQVSSLSAYNLPSAVSTSQYNAANQQLVFGSYRLLYDASGNVTNIVNGAVTNNLGWNARNQLANLTGAATANFNYDGLGRRITRTVAGVTENYLYDGLDVVQQLDGNGLPRARYFEGLAIDEPWQRSEISFIYEAGVTNGLRGWWKMNEGSGTSVADSSGNGNTATLSNGPTWSSGIASNAVVLDGSNDYLSVGDKATLEGNATWTFAAWINPDTFNSGRDTWLFYKQNVLQWGLLSGASRQISVNIGGGGNNSLQGAVTNSTQLSSNAWTHVAVTYTNAQVKFYVNGALVDTISKTYTMGSNNKAFTVSTATESFDGKLDDMRYYNRALSDAEIVGVYGLTATNRMCFADALGSVVALADSTGAIVTRYGYEPFGATTTTGAASKNSYRFTGREDDGTGMYYTLARYYHPALGRYLREDPIEYRGGDINLYAYCGNDPINWFDPLGLDRQMTRSDYRATMLLVGAGTGFINEIWDIATVGIYRWMRHRWGSGYEGTGFCDPYFKAGYNFGSAYADVAFLAYSYSQIMPGVTGPGMLRFESRIGGFGESPFVYRQGTFPDPTKGWPGNRIFGQQWSPENPLTTGNYAQKYGLPGGNSGSPDWIIGGRVQGGFSTRSAPPSFDGAGNTGGSLEILPVNVILDWFYMP